MSAAEHIPNWMIEWARLEPHIENALQYSGGTHTLEDVFLAVAQGDMQFWPGKESAIVTELVDTPRKRSLHFFLAGGNLPELEVMADEIERWAKEKQKVDNITLTGRPGWTRTFLRDRGYKTAWTTMSKELSNEQE